MYHIYESLKRAFLSKQFASMRIHLSNKYKRLYQFSLLLIFFVIFPAKLLDFTFMTFSGSLSFTFCSRNSKYGGVLLTTQYIKMVLDHLQVGIGANIFGIKFCF